MNTNKIYTFQYKDGNCHFVIVCAASSSEVARDHVKNLIGIDTEPTWLMSASYPTIYTSNGSKPEEKQAKILYNGNCHF